MTIMSNKPVAQSHWNLDEVVAGLREQRARWREARHRSLDSGGREFPARDVMQTIMDQLCGALFPMRLGPAELRAESEDYYVGHTLDTALNALYDQVQLELSYTARQQGRDVAEVPQQARDITDAFAAYLPIARGLLDTDVEAAYEGDPAARSVDEVLLCYPGVMAVIYHRLAHKLYRLEAPLLARIIAELSHSATGIDIHPGAQIGSRFFIDHGTGVVIGETAVIGDHVRLYQAVTLGAKRFASAEDGSLIKGQPRHPIVEDDVVIYAGATILGRVTIGRGSSIGGNVWLTRSVPPGSNITQAQSEQHSPSASPSLGF